jgi:uncharacterized protein (DUF4415 family)
MPKPSKPAARKTSPSKGRADLARLRRTSDAEIARTSPRDLQDLPETMWQEARVVTPVEKQAISIRLDRDVLEFFRASGPRYQSQINAVLRSYVEHATATARPRRKRAV